MDTHAQELTLEGLSNLEINTKEKGKPTVNIVCIYIYIYILNTHTCMQNTDIQFHMEKSSTSIFK